MLILKPLFCYSKEDAEGNQMTMIVKSEEDKCSVQIYLNKLPVIPQIERKGLLPSGRQFTNTSSKEERITAVTQESHCYASDRDVFLIFILQPELRVTLNLKCMCTVKDSFYLTEETDGSIFPY